MKRIALLFLAFGISASTLLAQDKAPRQDTTRQEKKKMECRMDCCSKKECTKECKKDSTEMKKNCTKTKKEDTVK